MSLEISIKKESNSPLFQSSNTCDKRKCVWDICCLSFKCVRTGFFPRDVHDKNRKPMILKPVKVHLHLDKANFFLWSRCWLWKVNWILLTQLEAISLSLSLNVNEPLPRWFHHCSFQPPLSARGKPHRLAACLRTRSHCEPSLRSDRLPRLLPIRTIKWVVVHWCCILIRKGLFAIERKRNRERKFSFWLLCRLFFNFFWPSSLIFFFAFASVFVWSPNMPLVKSTFEVRALASITYKHCLHSFLHTKSTLQTRQRN